MDITNALNETINGKPFENIIEELKKAGATPSQVTQYRRTCEYLLENVPQETVASLRNQAFKEVFTNVKEN